MASGIRDKVAILGMGCSRFGERWDAGTPQLLSEAFDEALADFAEAYGDQTERDHDLLVKAIKAGKVPAIEDV